MSDLKLFLLILWEFLEIMTFTIRVSYICNYVSLHRKEEDSTIHYIGECETLVMESEYADFRLLNIAVAPNALIYFNSHVLYFRDILGL